MLLAVASLINELVAIMYATVATNKLTEVPVEPAKSVFALIKRDYELQWIATNVHFMLGLLGFCGMIALRALCIYPGSLNINAAGLALSALVGMISIMNVGIAEGDGKGHTYLANEKFLFFGGNIISLSIRYIALLIKTFARKKTVMGMISFALFSFFFVRSIQNLTLPPESSSEDV